MKDTTVADLIAYLQTKPQDMVVIHSEHSEYVVLELSSVYTQDLCTPREDGWVHSYRPDKPHQTYLVLN